MNYAQAMKHYQKVGLQSQIATADPHRLIQMLMQGGIDRVLQAKGALEHGQLAEKGELIGKSIAIIGGLREVLDFEAGGEVALNLDRLYDYMTRRLTEANLKNDPSMLEEVANLLREVKTGWDSISSAPQP
ncbi:flagellar protein FliS [Azomonas agilis]|uniref:Flagellar secretion chaperone FliS n=1 Tax=Azomonas agilis TaxID=116849 RepID=A0A562I0W6_9GAMM|nr:flagellar export chaperone FliS [Azomonas agilis]TWH64364.1 flagellar protein FliS [Azomonas agilis]